MIDASGCIPQSIRCPKNISSFTKRLVNKIDMVPYGEPQIVLFGSGNKKGYTLVQLIETSNITAHFVEETNDVYFDVFSCKPFQSSDVLSVIDESFKPTSKKVNFIVRQAPIQQLR
jgi:S-adenosylmethionine/arginine decarboxylase-like enzyme